MQDYSLALATAKLKGGFHTRAIMYLGKLVQCTKELWLGRIIVVEVIKKRCGKCKMKNLQLQEIFNR